MMHEKTEDLLAPELRLRQSSGNNPRVGIVMLELQLICRMSFLLGSAGKYIAY